MIGKLSSGILEATSFETPTVNVRGRQTSRKRNANTVDVVVTGDAVRYAIAQALDQGGCDCRSICGDGKSTQRIPDLSLSAILLNKIIRY